MPRGHVPSYTAIRRAIEGSGLLRQKRRKRRGNEELPDESRERFKARETRSYESEYVHGLWHLDYHAAQVVRIVLASGALVTLKLLGIQRRKRKPHWLAGDPVPVRLLRERLDRCPELALPRRCRK